MPRVILPFEPGIDDFVFNNTWPANSQAARSDVYTLVETFTGDPAQVFAAALFLLGVHHNPDPTFNGIVLGSCFAALEAWKARAGTAPSGTFGMCGGMAYAALDYWHLQWVVPRAPAGAGRPWELAQPRYRADGGTQASEDLRGYILQRAVDGLKTDAIQFLKWKLAFMFAVGPTSHLPIGLPINLFLLVTAAIYEETRTSHWAVLKSRIDAGEPCAPALVGRNVSPLEDHVVMCYGYDDTLAPQSARLYIYGSPESFVGENEGSWGRHAPL